MTGYYTLKGNPSKSHLRQCSPPSGAEPPFARNPHSPSPMQGIYKSIKYNPCSVRPQCLRCNKFLHGNLGAYAIALGKRFGFRILQTSERRAKLYIDYTIPVLEKMTAIAKLGAKEYFIYYESIRPEEEKELAKAA
jgi:hypothetical protein